MSSLVWEVEPVREIIAAGLDPLGLTGRVPDAAPEQLAQCIYSFHHRPE